MDSRALVFFDGIKEYLTFKGGTSLSKVYRIIERFSEDIDISIERAAFGFDETQAPEKLDSRSQQKKVLEKLSESCSSYIHKVLLSLLKKNIHDALGTVDGWKLYSDEDDATKQTLLFEYPRAAKKSDYIRPIIKIRWARVLNTGPSAATRSKAMRKKSLKTKLTNRP